MLTSEAEIFLNFPMGQKSQHFDFGTPRRINSGMLLDGRMPMLFLESIALANSLCFMFIAPLCH